MTTKEKRQSLTRYLETAEDQKILAMYTLLEKELLVAKHTSLEEYNNDLLLAELEIKAGETLEHKDVVTFFKDLKK
jgi:hypothetical protein